MPRGVPVAAAADGVVWAAGVTERGHHVVLVHDHGHRSTFYQHLEALAQPFKRGDVIRAGTVLGPAGFDPSGGQLRHLHFELRTWDAPRRAWVSIDPAPFLAQWPVVAMHNV
jgi:murein DD-endopeptidase MepM/ murein hydrolase activator NlpD